MLIFYSNFFILSAIIGNGIAKMGITIGRQVREILGILAKLSNLLNSIFSVLSL